MQGVYLRGKRWRVRKFGYHIGTYDTKEEAERVVLEEEEKQLKFKYMQQYVEAKKWLQERGYL